MIWDGVTRVPRYAKPDGGWGSTPATNLPDVPSYYLPQKLQFISWDYPAIAHAGVDIDYKMTGYDWFNRPLNWEVLSGPEGMTIDSDGTLHWTPDTDQTSESVTLRILAGASGEQIKTFTISVDNSRCYFVDGSVETSGDGTIGAPVRHFLEALEGIDPSDQGRVIYFRDGVHEHNDLSWTGQEPSHPLRKLLAGGWDQDTPVLFRGYPGEQPQLLVTNSSGPYLGNGVGIMNMEIAGDGTVNGSFMCRLGRGSFAKKAQAKNAYVEQRNNPCGFRYEGSVILDSCSAKDNYDRNDLSHHNSCNYMFFGTSGLEGRPDTFVIDCISEGYSVVGYKIKHAGAEGRQHIHRSVSYGTRNPYAGANNASSINHSLMYSAAADGSTLGLSVTDPTTSGENNMDEGMMVINTTVITNGSNASSLTQARYAFSEPYEYRARYQRCTIINIGDQDGAGFYHAPYNELDANWYADFNDNEFYTPSSSNLIKLGQNTQYSVNHLNDNYGSGNTWSDQPPDITRALAGHMWAYSHSNLAFSRDGQVMETAA